MTTTVTEFVYLVELCYAAECTPHSEFAVVARNQNEAILKVFQHERSPIGRVSIIGGPYVLLEVK